MVRRVMRTSRSRFSARRRCSRRRRRWRTRDAHSARVCTGGRDRYRSDWLDGYASDSRATAFRHRIGCIPRCWSRHIRSWRQGLRRPRRTSQEGRRCTFAQFRPLTGRARTALTRGSRPLHRSCLSRGPRKRRPSPNPTPLSVLT